MFKFSLILSTFEQQQNSQSMDPPPRHVLWVATHKDKKGNFISEATKQVSKRMISIFYFE